MKPVSKYDYTIEQKVDGVHLGRRYYYRLLHGSDSSKMKMSDTYAFKTFDSHLTEKNRTFMSVIECIAISLILDITTGVVTLFHDIHITKLRINIFDPLL